MLVVHASKDYIITELCKSYSIEASRLIYDDLDSLDDCAESQSDTPVYTCVMFGDINAYYSEYTWNEIVEYGLEEANIVGRDESTNTYIVGEY